MSADSTPSELYRRLLSALSASLRELGYTRSGALLRRVQDGNAALVGFQKSSGSDKQTIRFTINLGIVVGALLDERETNSANITDAHLSERLGALLPERSDKWWEIDSDTNIEAMIAEISSALRLEGVPLLDQYTNTEALIRLWQSGRSPGLTEKQRLRYLNHLGAAASS